MVIRVRIPYGLQSLAALLRGFFISHSFLTNITGVLPAIINPAIFPLYFHFVHAAIQNGNKSIINRRGFASANSPDITTNGTVLVPEDWSGSGVFQTGLALRVDLGNQAFFTGGLDYRYLSPTFKVDSGILSEEATQKISVLKLGVGIGINF